MTNFEIIMTTIEFILFITWVITSYRLYKKHSFELALIAGIIAFLFLGFAVLNFNFNFK